VREEGAAMPQRKRPKSDEERITIEIVVDALG
jgi:hypothetical protein